jgi:hypothetical protein
VITQEQAAEAAGGDVRLTLADGTELEGYLFPPGYQGVRIMVQGIAHRYYFSEIKSVEVAR